jgi:RNA polymerase sigma factor (TIGR02999 family)
MAESVDAEETTPEPADEGSQEGNGGLPAAELLPRLYRELHRLAARLMAEERDGHTLQPTALLHEAWAKLAGSEPDRRVNDDAHLMRLAARAMRQVLVDHARARAAAKRGRRVEVEFLEEWLVGLDRRSIDVLALHEALERLAALDEDLARVVELRFFGGLSIAETARAMELSDSSVERSWRTARAWLQRELEAESG